MSTETPGSPVAAATSAVKPPLKKNWLAALAKRRIVSACVLSVVLVAGYWTFVASDRYVSESHVIIQSTDLPGGQSMDFSSILGGGDSGRRAEQLLLRDYLLSVDVLKKLDLKLDLRSHYSSSKHDLVSRMWSKDASMERFFHYYQSRVSIEYDDYAGVLVIKSQGFDPKMAHDINIELVREGERFMNLMARSLAQEQVIFLEKQVADLGARASEATHAVVEYQNKRGLVSPQATTESISGIVAKLDSQRAELETRRSAALAYLVPTPPRPADCCSQPATGRRAVQAGIEQRQSPQQLGRGLPGTELGSRIHPGRLQDGPGGAGEGTGRGLAHDQESIDPASADHARIFAGTSPVVQHGGIYITRLAACRYGVPDRRHRA